MFAFLDSLFQDGDDVLLAHHICFERRQCFLKIRYGLFIALNYLFTLLQLLLQQIDVRCHVHHLLHLVKALL